MKQKMTEEKLREAIVNVQSIAGALQIMNMSVTTANYRAFHKMVKQHKLDTSHFLGQAHLKNKARNIKTTKSLDEILVENSEYLNSSYLKSRLLKSNKLEYRCYVCSLHEWLGKAISLQLDHINGVPNDHRIENLRLLCPNCHSQTETFAGKNKCGAPRES